MKIDTQYILNKYLSSKKIRPTFINITVVVNNIDRQKILHYCHAHHLQMATILKFFGDELLTNSEWAKRFLENNQHIWTTRHVHSGRYTTARNNFINLLIDTSKYKKLKQLADEHHTTVSRFFLAFIRALPTSQS